MECAGEMMNFFLPPNAREQRLLFRSTCQTESIAGYTVAALLEWYVKTTTIHTHTRAKKTQTYPFAKQKPICKSSIYFRSLSQTAIDANDFTIRESLIAIIRIIIADLHKYGNLKHNDRVSSKKFLEYFFCCF